MTGKRELLRDFWNAQKKDWRRSIAVMKTRGFWCVQVVWFAAGGLFFRLLPPRAPDVAWLNYVLNQVLIAVIMLPVYFTMVLSWSVRINGWIDRYRDSQKSKP